MANCPKCNAKLKITDWRPECPHCGVNMLYYGMEEGLVADAEKAEAEHAKFQRALDRVKASIVGGPLQICRIIFAILPVAALFLPLAKLNIADAPYIAAHSVNVNILTLVSFFTDYFDVNGLLGVISSPLVGKAFITFALSIVLLVLSVLMGIFLLVRNFCSSKVSSCKKNVAVSVVKLLLIAGSAVCFNIFASSISAVFPDFISASLGFGIFVYAALCLPLVVANIIFIKKPMEVKYTELPDYSEADKEMLAEAAEEEAVEAVEAAVAE